MDKKVNENYVELEEAIKRTGFGRFNYTLIVLAGSLLTCAFIEVTSVNLVMTVAQCDLELTTSDKGILGAIGYVGIIVSSHFWGFMADTRGRRNTLIPSLIIAFVVTFISSFVNNFWLLVFLRFLNGFFISCPSSSTFAYLGEFHDAKNRARVLMISSVLYSFTSLLMPSFALLIINQEWSFPIELLNVTYKPWRLFLVASSLPCLACGIALMLLTPESPKFTFSQGDECETLRILQKMYSINTGKSIESYPVKTLKKDGEYGEGIREKSEGFLRFMWSQSAPLFRGRHLRNFLTACFVQFAVCSTCNGFWTFFPEIMNRITLWTASDPSHVSATVCEIWHSVGNSTTGEMICTEKLELGTFANVFKIISVYAIFYFTMSLVINRLGKLVLMLIVTFCCGSSALLLIFIRVPLVSMNLYIVMLLAGLGISIINASTVELFPTKMRAMAICISMMAGRVGSVTASTIIGFFIDEHCKLTFLMPTVLLFITGILAFTIPNINKRFK